MASVDPSTITTSTALGPAVTVTPASPTTTSPSSAPTPVQPSTSTVPNAEMKEKSPTDSETALLAKGTAGPSTETKPARSGSPIDTLTRKLSGEGGTDAVNPSITQSTKQEKSKNTTTATAPTSAPVASTSRSTPASTSKPAVGGASNATGKKKKRKGLAGFFAALGCLSTYEVEDEPSKSTAAKKDMAQRPGAGVTKPSTATATATGTTTSALATSPKVETAEATKHQGETTDATATTGTTLVDDASKVQPETSAGTSGVPREAVVLPPAEPVLPIDETAGVTSGAVQPPGSGSELLSTPHRPGAVRRESDTTPQQLAPASSSAEATSSSGGYTDISESEVRTGSETAAVVDEQEYGIEEEYEDEEDRLIAQGGMGIPLDENGHPAPLLPVMDKVHQGRKCLVLDLDETLLHSSFKMLPSADYIVPVEIESQVHNVYVIKRPGVDHFLTEMGKIYEVVVFTASLSKYADPVLDMLDPAGVVRHRLFRESCYNHKGNYVKDLSQLGRDMEGCIIIDNSPASYIFHPTNAVPVSTWFNDPHDTELTDLCPFLTDLATVDDIRGVLDGTI